MIPRSGFNGRHGIGNDGSNNHGYYIYGTDGSWYIISSGGDLMDLKELDNIAKQQANRAKKHQKIFDENPGTIIIFYEDGIGVTKDLEEFEYQ